MSIATAITAAQGRVADCYTAISNKGGTLPATQNLANMPTAIGSIPSGSTPTLITKTITQNGTYNASSDNADGYSSVTVNVSGGSGYTEFPSYQVVNGAVIRKSKALDGTEFSNITSVGGLGLYSAFSRCSGLTGILNLSALTTIDSQGCYNAFQNCSGLTGVDLSSLTTVGSYGLGDAFSGCSGLTTVRLPSLTSISSSGFSGTFRSCQNLTSVYFNSLKTTSFGNKNAFVSLMASTGKTVTHTLHFPSNLTSTISGLNGYPLFGGTSGYVTLSFDLPATS